MGGRSTWMTRRDERSNDAVSDGQQRCEELVAKGYALSAGDQGMDADAQACYN